MIEHLNAAIFPIRHVDVSCCIGCDAMRQIELTRPSPPIAPGLHPVAVLVILRHTRIDVSVTDESVAFRIPRHIGRLTELPLYRRARRIHARPGSPSSDASFFRPNTMSTRPSGSNLITMSDPLSTAHKLSSLSTRTVWAKDHAYRLWPISRMNFPSGPNSNTCEAVAP